MRRCAVITIKITSRSSGDEKMNRYKMYRLLAILAGIVVGLVCTLCIAGLVITKIKKDNIKVLHTDFTVNVVPYLSQNLEDYLAVSEEETVIYDQYDYTEFGQPINEENELVLFGKTANSFQGNDLENVLQRTLRKMYIDDSVNDIYDFEKVFSSNYLFTEEQLEEVPVTGTFIDGLYTLDDGNSACISTELRCAIILFVKGYLGCGRVNQVVVEKEVSEEWPHRFILRLPNDAAAYTFDYSYDNTKDKLNYMVIRRRE